MSRQYIVFNSLRNYARMFVNVPVEEAITTSANEIGAEPETFKLMDTNSDKVYTVQVRSKIILV